MAEYAYFPPPYTTRERQRKKRTLTHPCIYTSPDRTGNLKRKVSCELTASFVLSLSCQYFCLLAHPWGLPDADLYDLLKRLDYERGAEALPWKNLWIGKALGCLSLFANAVLGGCYEYFVVTIVSLIIVLRWCNDIINFICFIIISLLLSLLFLLLPSLFFYWYHH